MDNQFIFFLLVALVFAGIIFYSYYFSKKAIVKRKLKKASGKRISDFISGEIAKVVGQIEIIGNPITAPLSGRPCAYYYILIEEKVSSGKSSHWNKLIEEEVSGSFVIKDGRYYAHINCNHVKSYLVEDKIYSSGFLHDADETIEKYLEEHGEKSEGFLGFNRTLRYKEGVLEKGELIAVVGRGEWKNPNQLHLPEFYRRVLDISSTEEEAVYLSDDPDTVETLYH